MTPERSEDLEAAKQMQDADNAARWQVFMQIAAVDVAREALRGLLAANLVGMWLRPEALSFRVGIAYAATAMFGAYAAQWSVAERKELAPIVHIASVVLVAASLVALVVGLAHV